jgi:hypothetical protein
MRWSPRIHDSSFWGIPVHFVQNRFSSRREIFLIFCACVFPIHIWAIVNTLRELPSYLLRLNLIETTSIFCYTLFFALIESISISTILVLLSALLPTRLFKDFFVYQGSLFLFITSVWILPIHYRSHLVQGLSISFPLFVFLLWIWITSYIVIMVGCYILIRRRTDFREKISGLLERITIPALFYILLDVISILIIAYRNLL